MQRIARCMLESGVCLSQDGVLSMQLNVSSRNQQKTEVDTVAIQGVPQYFFFGFVQNACVAVGDSGGSNPQLPPCLATATLIRVESYLQHAIVPT